MKPPTLGIVVPIGPGDQAWRALLSDLRQIPMSHEVVLVFADSAEAKQAKENAALCQYQVVHTEPSRGKQLNAGARATHAPHLWFVHADTRFYVDTCSGLQRVLSEAKNALYYFDLRFSDGHVGMRFNELGVALRCRLWALPFGDQAFVISRELFQSLGRFDERAGLAEDHALVWAAKRARMPILPTGSSVQTSARRYIERGWWATTWLHLRKTWQQARDYSRPTSP